MRNRKSTGFGIATLSSLTALSALAACGDVDDGDETPDPSTTARVRVAHLSPDAPAVDFCLAVAGSGKFSGPVLAGAGGLAGISYGKLTRYLDVPAAAYDVRLVAPASSDCSKSLGNLPDITDLPTLSAGTSATIAATGKLAHGGAPFTLRAYIDDAAPLADKAKLRFIHASPGTPNVDVGLGGGVAFSAVFADVAYGSFQPHELGYVTTAPLTAVELSARATGTTADVLSIKPASLPAGAIATAFAIGELGSAATPLQVLLCNDSAPPHQIETECTAVGAAPERAKIRVAHLSPDAPAVDVCLAPAGSGAFTKPLLASLGARAGLAYPQVTEYVQLPVASYDVRIVLATETTCANPAVPDTSNVTLTRDLTATVAAIGALDRSGPAIADPGFRLAVYADSLTAAAGKAKLRFIHASPGTPNVDVGILAPHFIRLFGNVEFGKVAVHGGIDAQGYLEANPLNATIAARLANATTDALVIPNVSLPAGAIATAFAIGGKTGATTNPLRVLLCTDSVRTTSLLAQCVVAP